MFVRIAAPILALALFAALPAGAQQAEPSPAPSAPAFPIALPSVSPATQSIIDAASSAIKGIIRRNREEQANTTHGTVSYFRRFELQVKIGANQYRDVHLHQGTVINPRGATPDVGRYVDVSGTGRPDGSLAADTITVHQ